MKILFIEWASFGNEDMKEAFVLEGHTVVRFPFSNKDARQDAIIEAEFASVLHRETPDVVFPSTTSRLYLMFVRKKASNIFPGFMTVLM